MVEAGCVNVVIAVVKTVDVEAGEVKFFVVVNDAVVVAETVDTTVETTVVGMVDITVLL